ncbi:MAG: hypothetical protein PHD32_07180 [Eubacteriales bacterium]|nr:hypothetical protein [Eubacteriales bacterium]
MKKMLFAISLLLALCTACSGEGAVRTEKNASTDLSQVALDEIALGGSVQSLDLTKYTPASGEENADSANTHSFEEVQIKTDPSGTITFVKGILGTGIQARVNGAQPSSLREAIELLGSNYHEYWFDREQNLKACTYYDAASKSYATFVSFDDGLVWLILSQ